MSLKIFHIAFIAVSTLVAFFFGVWASFRALSDGQPAMFAVGALGFAAGIGLVWYGRGFIQKLKNAGIY